MLTSGEVTVVFTNGGNFTTEFKSRRVLLSAGSPVTEIIEIPLSIVVLLQCVGMWPVADVLFSMKEQFCFVFKDAKIGYRLRTSVSLGFAGKSYFLAWWFIRNRSKHP